MLALLIRLAIFAPSGAQAADVLAWDAFSKTNLAKPGQLIARFVFTATNVSPAEVVVDQVTPSCGCTVAKLPSHPWRLATNASGSIELAVDLRRQTGALLKTADVAVGKVAQKLMLNVVIPPGTTNGPGTETDNRIWNQELSAGDHQAVFHDNCVQCHLIPAFGKTGAALYSVSCGICHDSPRRAAMVPDLHALKKPTDADYWRKWVAFGKEGTLMPGSAATEGGPLDGRQINSLVEYLLATFPSKP